MKMNQWQIKLIQWKKRREEIYMKYQNGSSMNQLAREYNISTTRIHNIIKKFAV